MKLCFLGRGSAFCDRMGNTSAYLREGGRMLLLDCGESVFHALMTRSALDGVTELYVAVSHTHSDHCGSLGTLLQYCIYGLHIPLTVVVPEDGAYIASLRQLLLLFGAKEDQIHFLPARELSGFSSFSSMRIVPTEHVPGMQAFSFVFETPAGGVFYSADTKTPAQLQDFIASHPDFEAAYMDSAETTYPGTVHYSVGELAEMIPPELRSRVFIMHMNSAACLTKGQALGFSPVSVD